jgi:hypothetical protein
LCREARVDELEGAFEILRQRPIAREREPAALDVDLRAELALPTVEGK